MGHYVCNLTALSVCVCVYGNQRERERENKANTEKANKQGSWVLSKECIVVFILT